MALTSKTKAFTFAAGLLLVSSIMVGTAIASTGSSLSPFARGADFAKERSLTRGHFVALGVNVGQMVDGELEPLSGATVTLSRPDHNDSIESKQTDSKGVAIFEVKPGAYEINVTSGDLVASDKVGVGHSMRVGVYFDEDGQAHWKEASHKELERRGDQSGVMVQISRNESGKRVPVPNATVSIYKAGGERELVQEAQTGPRGVATFQLPQGMYVIAFEAGNASGEHDLPVRKQVGVHILIDGDDVEWRGGQIGEHGKDHGPASDRPARPPKSTERANHTRGPK